MACASRSGQPAQPIGYTLFTEQDTAEARGDGAAPPRRRTPVLSAALSPEALGEAAFEDDAPDAPETAEADGEDVTDEEPSTEATYDELFEDDAFAEAADAEP
jgi:hypothetical protein